ncbi:MAG: hypothetical protein EXR43_00480 [Dehalococcoidia bacterium]|nr:hypothetical protein [Dehalococcoidia bacterium]
MESRIGRFPSLAAFLRQFDPAPWPWPTFATAVFSSVAIYVGVFLRALLWLPGADPSTALLGLPVFFGSTPRGLAEWTFMVGVLFALWFIMLRAAAALSPSKLGIIAIVLSSAVCHASLVSTFPVTNSDVLHYVADARLIWEYRANPLIVPPTTFAIPDLTPNTWWWQASPYGPLWQIIGLGTLAAGFNLFYTSLMAFKAMAVLFSLATSLLIFLTTLRLAPKRAMFAATFFSLNPLTIMLVSIGGQNEAAMMFFATMGYFFLIRRQWLWAPTMLVCAALIKLSALLFLPVAMLYLIRKAGLVRALGGLALAFVTAILLYAPFFEGADTFAVIRWQSRQFTTSLAALMVLYLRDELGAESAMDLARTVSAGLFLTAAAVIVAVWWRRRSDAFLAAIAYLVLAYSFIGVAWWQPWYLLWLIVPVAMTSGHRPLMLITIVFCWSAMMTYSLAYGWALWWPDAGVEAEARVQTIQVLTVFLPPFLVLLGVFTMRLSRRAIGPSGAPVSERDAGL